MKETAILEVRKKDLGSPSRDEIKQMLNVVWRVENRIEVAATCLSTFMQVCRDRGLLMISARFT